MSLIQFSQWRNLMLRGTDGIKIIGYNGDECTISGPGMGDWGPILAPHSTGLFAAPFKTNWAKSMLGQKFVSGVPQRRDIAFTMHILNPETGDPYLDRDLDLWHLVYSRFRAMFHPLGEVESTVVYTSVNGERRLGIRLIEAPKPFVGGDFEGRDPHLLRYGSVGMLVGCENPYYIGATEKYAHEIPGLVGDAWFNLPYYNPSSAQIWPRWKLLDRAQYTLPDYSFGWEEYGTGIADLGKTFPVPMLVEGENVEVDSSPDVMTIVAENENPVMQRCNGRDLEYPIQPGMGDPENGCVVVVNNCTNPLGARVELFLPRWYTDPFSTPLVVGTSVGVPVGIGVG